MLDKIDRVNFDSKYNTNINLNGPVHESLLKPSQVNKELISGLSNFQKTLLITDGTVTELLEYYLDESINVKKINEEREGEFESLPSCHKHVINHNDMPVLKRQVLLQGMVSLSNWLYAESSILIDNLPEQFRHDLLVSNKPIGKLWSKYRLETYKTDFTIKKEFADEKLAKYFDVEINSEILSRTYSVFSHGKRTMVITEKFSTNRFLD